MSIKGLEDKEVFSGRKIPILNLGVVVKLRLPGMISSEQAEARMTPFFIEGNDMNPLHRPLQASVELELGLISRLGQSHEADDLRMNLRKGVDGPQERKGHSKGLTTITGLIPLHKSFDGVIIPPRQKIAEGRTDLVESLGLT